MSQDSNSARANKPQESSDRRCNKAQRDCNAKKGCVKLRRGSFKSADLQVSPFKLANPPHSTYNKYNVEQQLEVGEQAVYAEHNKHNCIIAGEVTQVIIHSRLDLTEVGRFGKSLEIEEFRDGFEVGESGSD